MKFKFLLSAILILILSLVILNRNETLLVFAVDVHGDDITGVWTNVELNNTSVSGPTDGFYWLKEEGVLASGTLTEGQTYACTVLY